MSNKFAGPAVMAATIGALLALQIPSPGEIESGPSKFALENPPAGEYVFADELAEARKLMEEREGEPLPNSGDEELFAAYIADTCRMPFWDGAGKRTYDDLPNICKRNRHLWDEGFPDPEAWRAKCEARGGYLGEDWGCYVP